MSHGKASRKTTIWLGSDDGEEGGWEGGGFDVTSEDDMVSVSGSLEDDEDTVEVFICRDLFAKIRAVMDMIDRRYDRDQRDSQAVADRIGKK